MKCISGINATKYGPHGYGTLLSIVACTLMRRMRAFFATLVGGDLEPLHPIPKRAIRAPALEHPTIVIPGSGSQRDDLPIKGQDDERAETTTGWRN